MPSQHFQEELLLFSEGASYAVEAEFAGLASKKSYLDARNMRMMPMNDNDYAVMKISGEELKYAAIYNQCIGGDGSAIPVTYKGMCFIECNDYLFEVWCDKLKVLPTFFRINGKIVAMSADIPFTVDYGIQWHKNESCIGGEVFVSDDHSAPQIYNIKDLLENSGIDFETGQNSGILSCTQKYFADYDLALFTINQRLPADHPVFIEIASSLPPPTVTIGTGGLKGGQYQYAFRYVNTAGDATLFCEPTPLISVPQAIGANAPNYPYLKTYGAPAAGDTIFGVHFRFRVTNLLNYDHIEIRRISFNTGAAIGSVGVDEIVYLFDVLPGEISIKDILDIGSIGTALTTDDSTNVMGVIDHAKGIRYFDKQLYLANITYASRSVDNIEFLTSPDTMYPVMWKMTNPTWKAGHKDAWNSTYRKSLLHGEKYGWGVKFLDGYGSRSFVAPVPGSSSLAPAYWGGNFNDFQMPNRRDPALSQSDLNGLVTAANTQFATTTTYEVFDLVDSIFKDDPCQYKNIADLGDPGDWKTEAQVDFPGCDIYIPGVSETATRLTPPFTGVRVNYQPFHPVSAVDSDVSGHNMVVNVAAWTDFNNTVTYADDQFHPKGFSPNYYSMGMGMTGINSMPDWVSAFSIVRTPAAGRIFCQGLGFYSLNPADYNTIIGDAARTTKNLNKLWFYSPDSESGLVNMDEVIDGIASQKYSIQFVSPLGFFSEVFNFRSAFDFDANRDYNIDMITYARILFEDGSINFGDTTGDIGAGDGYVGYSQYRNTNARSNKWDAGNKGNNTFLITGAIAKASVTGSPNIRQVFYELTVDGNDIYANFGTTGGNDKDFNDTNTRRWHEPMYIVNIIRNDTSIDTSTNQQQYLNTEHYQKINSYIGVSSGALIQSFKLVDERWEDCITTNSAEDKFVYIKDLNGNEVPWINIANKNAGQISTILNDIQTGTGTYGNVGGVYTQTITQLNGSDRYYYVNFDATGVTGALIPFYVPSANYLIDVHYDKNYPCVAFGGDVVVGEAVWAPIDGKTGEGGDSDTSPHDDQFAWGVGFPYFRYEMNPRYYIMNSTTDIFNRIQNQTKVTLGYIRQMVCMFCCESRISTPLSFNMPQIAANYPYEYFPLINYVMRPQKWDSGDNVPDNHVFDTWADADNYADELDGDGLPAQWPNGGFRFHQSTPLTTNVDYSEEQNNFINTSKPVVGFVEVNHFCTRNVWSVTREINVQNSPGLKTFPPLNFRDINDNTGEIVKLWDAWTSSGNNLYAFTESGICLMLTNKFIARQQDGDQLGLLQGDEGASNIMEELWLSKDTGMNNEMWRSFADYNNIAFFANSNSVYRLEDNKLYDVGRQFYHSRIYNDLLKIINPGYEDDLTGHYDIYHSEYWLNYRKRPYYLEATPPDAASITEPLNSRGIIYEVIGDTEVVRLPTAGNIDEVYIVNKTDHDVDIKYPIGSSAIVTLAPDEYSYLTNRNLPPPVIYDWTHTTPAAVTRALYGNITFVFQDGTSSEDRHWLGWYDFDFDKYASIENRTFGIREAETYELHKGRMMNGELINAHLFGATTGGGTNQRLAKEFAKMKVNSDNRPTSLEFYDTIAQERSGIPLAILDIGTDSLYLKNYDGWENYVPRKTLTPFNRMQGRLMLYKVLHSADEDFKIIDIQSFFKPLK